MKTISFYSYKGGVGRTLALAYTATYLARKNKNVCILDMDLEAPGVLYKFQSGLNMNKFQNDLNMNKKGIVEYINECTKKKFPEDITNFFYTIPQEFYVLPENSDTSLKKPGYIKIMNAGKDIDKADYFNILSKIDWNDLFSTIDSKYAGNEYLGEGLFLFEKLKRQIKEQLNPDYLFIDSRSGVTVMSKLCISVLPDTVVMFFANNKENRSGSKILFHHIKNSTYSLKQDGISIICALTRIQKHKTFSECMREFDAISSFVESMEDSNLRENDISVIHSDRDVEYDESFILRDNNFKNKPIIDDYWQLLKKIMGEDFVMERIELASSPYEDDSNEIAPHLDISDALKERIASYEFPINYTNTNEAIELAYVKTDKGLFLTDQSRTMKELDLVFELKEPDVIKNLVLLMREFGVKKYNLDLRIELYVEDSKEDQDRKVRDAKYRLYRCVLFMNKLSVLYNNDDKSDIMLLNKTDIIIPSSNIIERYCFPVKYYMTNDDYEFTLIKRGNEYFITDQGRTYEMLDKVFELKESDVTKNLVAIMSACNVQMVNNELLVKIDSLDENTLSGNDHKLREAKYRLFECVSFMDSMRVFYV